MTHLDLFSGIGGFALAAQMVWGPDYHCVGFCEIDSFCQNVLRKNFEGVPIYGDIRGLTAERLAADAASCGYQGRHEVDATEGGKQALDDAGGYRGRSSADTKDIDLLTGGFPCQPFSQAGKRRGTEDDRWLWPEMRRIVSETRPRWIIGENVPGIITLALDEVLSDLEGIGYAAQPLVIPACAVDAPHRRSRVWIVAARDTESVSIGTGLCESEPERQRGRRSGNADRDAADATGERRQGSGGGRESVNPSARSAAQADQLEHGSVGIDTDAESARREGEDTTGNGGTRRRAAEYAFPDWSRDWRDVAFGTCYGRLDDGLSRRMVQLPDGRRITRRKARQEAIKAYGNSIVPQVAMEIMRGIKDMDKGA